MACCDCEQDYINKFISWLKVRQKNVSNYVNNFCCKCNTCISNFIMIHYTQIAPGSPKAIYLYYIVLKTTFHSFIFYKIGKNNISTDFYIFLLKKQGFVFWFLLIFFDHVRGQVYILKTDIIPKKSLICSTHT